MGESRSPLENPHHRRRAAEMLLPLLVIGMTTVALTIGPEPREVGAQGSTVLKTRVDDAITPIIADHLSDVVTKAETGGYEALVVELDTPGGLSTSMRDIVQDFLDANVPIIVHVAPSGARAASAGALIGWSSHVLAMSPGTTIGAATPVDLEGGEVADKAVEDAAAFARAVAEERGRNLDIAAEAVTEGRALSSTEAVEAGAADLLADRSELLDAIDGMEVTLGDGTTTRLETAGATVDEADMSWLRSILQFLADPNLAFIFMSIGTLGLIYELATPGIGAAGGLGAALILLALVSLSVLPVDVAGLVFLLLAAILFVAELFAPGVGIAAALGSVSLVLAGIFAFSDDNPGLSISLTAILPTSIVAGLAVVVAGRLALRARSEPPASGPSGFIGHEIEVATGSGGVGQAQIGGSWWTLRGKDLEPGERVRVVSVDGIELKVEKVTDKEE